MAGLACRLMDMGVDEISISDTIGKATPDEVAELMDILVPLVPAGRIAVHFHDTYGNGVSNVLKSISYGIRVVDASVGGLGGRPFAPGATGNVSTEAIARELKKAGETVSIDMEAFLQARALLDPYLPMQPSALPDPASPACSNCEFFHTEQCCG